MADDYLAACGAFCACCCGVCSQTDQLWCFTSRTRNGPLSRIFCSCRRTMSDHEFERTVEQLYAPGTDAKQHDNRAAKETHVIELQPTHSRSGEAGDGDTEGEGKSGVTTRQPGPRPSMEARVRRSTSRSPQPQGPNVGPGLELEEDRERAILESRKDAKVRTRDWIAQQRVPGARGDRQHQRGPSEPALTRERSPARSGEGSRSHRANQSEGDAQLQRPVEAHVGGRSRRSPSPYLEPSQHAGRDEGSTEGMSSASRAIWEGGARARGEIPAMLRPGGVQHSVPAQVPFDMGHMPALAHGQGGYGQGQSRPLLDSMPPERRDGSVEVV